MSSSRRIVRTGLLTCAAMWGTAFADGTVILDLDGNSEDRLFVTRVGSDARIYVLAGPGGPDPQGCSILAFDVDGTLIGTFGSGGKVTATYCVPYDLAVKADNSFLVIEQPPLQKRVVVRDATGALQFTSDSLVPLPILGDHVTRLGLHPDGRILLGGTALSDPRFNSFDWTVRRLSAEGATDFAFAGGVLQKDVGGLNSEVIYALRGLADGRVLISGTTSPSTFGGPIYNVFARVNNDGSADGTFGFAGQVPLLRGSGQFALDSGGRIYVQAGERLVTRLSADGTLDTSYAGGTPIGVGPDVSGISLELDSMERALVMHSRRTGQQWNEHIDRFTTAGAPDTTLGGTGSAQIPIVAMSPGLGPGCSSAMQPNDKIILACAYPIDVAPEVGEDYDLVISRYNVDGTLDATFGQNQPDSDTYPDAFSFADKTAPFGTAYVEADPVTITGINTKAKASISSSGGYGIAQLSVGCTGTYTTGATVLPGQTICVRTQSANFPFGVYSTTLRVGVRSATFTVRATGEPADATPDAFAFVDQTDVPLATAVISNSVQIAGIAGVASVTVTGGQYSIGCDSNSFTTGQGSVTNGQTICVRHNSGAQPGTSVATRLTVGGVSDTFTTTTIPPDTTPDAFTFPSQNGVPIGGVVTSGEITIAGVNVAVPISIVGGEYAIHCHPSNFTSQTVNIVNGQIICVRHTAASQGSASTTTTLTVGGVVGTFTSTTAAASNNSGGGGGNRGGGGAVELFFLIQLTGVLSLIAACKIRRAHRPS
jgi:uncharacterized delta-60 repeat protein